jgi:hypothetical protein
MKYYNLIFTPLFFLLTACGGSNNTETLPTTSSPDPAATNVKINFEIIEDSNLRSCVSSTNVENIEDVTNLNCDEQNIESIAGIEQFTKLTNLSLNKTKL